MKISRLTAVINLNKSARFHRVGRGWGGGIMMKSDFRPDRADSDLMSSGAPRPQRFMKLPDGPKVMSPLQILQLVADPPHYLQACARQYGDPFTLRVLGNPSPPAVFFGHPEAIEAIFTATADTFELGRITHVFEPLTGPQSLIAKDGLEHRRLRQVLMPPLHGRQLPRYAEKIAAIASSVADSWRVGDTFSIRDDTADISLQTILRVVLGLAPGPLYNQLRQTIQPYLEWVNSPLNSVQFFWPPLQRDWGAWSPWGKFCRQRRQIDNLIDMAIRDRRDAPGGDDILSLLISARDERGEPLTDGELRDQIITLLLLGNDTTASALDWVFYWIHRHPEIRDQLTAELDGLGHPPDPLAATQLPYLTAVCREALRIHPIALISQPRLVRESVTIRGDRFEPGTVLVPCIHLAHRRSQTYPEPERFRPERFLERHFSPYEYFPFGGGSRTCVGMALSLFEMKIVLATVLSRCRFSLADRGPVRPVRRGITIVPSDNFQLTVEAVRPFSVPCYI